MGQRPDELRPPEGDSQPRSAGQDGDLESTTATARQEIEQTRAEMSSTIDAIQDRLDPELLSEQAKDTAHDVTDYAIREAKEAAREITDHAITQAKDAVRDVTEQATLALREATIGKVESMAHTATETAGGLRATVLATIKANPVPAALGGLGLGWMMLNRPGGSGSQGYRTDSGQAYGMNTAAQPAYRGQSSSGSGGSSGPGSARQKIGEISDTVQDNAGQVVDRVQETAGQMVDQVQETGGHVAEQVQEQASRAQGFLQREMEENPLLVGAVAALIGGVLAGTVPVTRREDQFLGHRRDQFMSSARELTEDTVDKVARVVGEAKSAAQDEAQKSELIPGSAATTSV